MPACIFCDCRGGGLTGGKVFYSLQAPGFAQCLKDKLLQSISSNVILVAMKLESEKVETRQ